MGKIVLNIEGRALHCIDPDMLELAQESGIIICNIAFHPLSPTSGSVILDTIEKLFLQGKSRLGRISSRTQNTNCTFCTAAEGRTAEKCKSI
jgi:hypothetical protein